MDVTFSASDLKASFDGPRGIQPLPGFGPPIIGWDVPGHSLYDYFDADYRAEKTNLLGNNSALPGFSLPPTPANGFGTEQFRVKFFWIDTGDASEVDRQVVFT